MPKTTLGLIVAHRDVFPDELAKRGRELILAKLKEANLDGVAVSEKQTKDGVVAGWHDAEVCAKLFREHMQRSTASW